MQLSSTFIRKIDRLNPDIRDAMLSLAEEVKDSPGKADIDELKAVTKELAEAEKASEARLTRLEKAVAELAEAEKASEARLTRLEKAVAELAEAQKRTENEISALTRTANETQKQVGGLSMAVGYGIEDRLMPYIFDFGKKVFGADMRTVDRRNIVHSNGNYDELNIYGEGIMNGKLSYIIGECKAQPGKKDFDRFARMVLRIKDTLQGDVYPFIVGYQFVPEVESYARKKYPEIKLFRTYEFEMNFQKHIPQINQKK